MGAKTPLIHLDIEALVLPARLVPHPEGFREALMTHLQRLCAERISNGGSLDIAHHLASATLSVPAGLDTNAAAAHAAAQLLTQLTTDMPVK
jgi:hypothetical protein